MKLGWVHIQHELYLCVLFNAAVNCNVYVASVRGGWMNVEQWSNDTEMEKTEVFRETCPSATLPTTDPTYATLLSLVQYLCIGWSGINCWGHGMTPSRFLFWVLNIISHAYVMPYCYDKRKYWFRRCHYTAFMWDITCCRKIFNMDCCWVYFCILVTGFYFNRMFRPSKF